MSEMPTAVAETEHSCVWLPPAVRESFLRLRRALHRGRFSQVDYLSRKFQKSFPAYAGYYLDTEAQAHRLRGRPDTALHLLREADSFFNSSNLPVLTTLIRTLLDREQLDDVRPLLENGRNRFPDHPELLFLWCRLLKQEGRFREALALLREQCRTASSPDFLSLSGELCFLIGARHEALKVYAEALDLDPYSASAWSHLLFFVHYLPDCTPAAQRELLRRWHATVCAPLPPTDPALLRRRPDPGKKLRIGLLSPGFGSHPVGWMTGHALSLLSRLPDCELYFYSTAKNPDNSDSLRRMLRKAASKWVEAGGWTARRAHAALSADRLDIAVDLAGHGEGGMLQVFAQRVAPIQVKWVGAQFNTTGLPQMDYMLSDRFETPEGCDAEYTEKLVRLPHSYISYELRNFGDTERADETSPLCFGCFNNPHKLNADIAATWSNILRRIPDSVLLIKGMFLQHEETREFVRSLFLEQGIEPERILLEGPSGHKELMQSYCRVDIALDPWPYTGGLTTLEALWMGVPVVTMPGPSFAGRHALSHLCNAGLDSLVADSPETYVEIAVKLAEDRELLKQLRVLLPWSVARSPLVRHDQLAADLHTAFRAMWQRYCEGLPPVAMRFEQPSEIPEEIAAAFQRPGFSDPSPSGPEGTEACGSGKRSG